MDFGDVVLENRPIVICQCKYNLCVTCNTPKDAHFVMSDIDMCLCGYSLKEHEDGAIGVCDKYTKPDHNFYQRSKTWGPRVVIDQHTKTGKCNDCGKQYEVNVFAHSEVVPY